MDRKHRAKQLAGLRESGLPSQAQIEQSKKNSELFKKADKAYKELLKFLKKWDSDVGDDDPTAKQLADIEKAVAKAKKDIDQFYGSMYRITNGTAASKLYKNVKSTIDGINWMLYGD